MAGVADPGCAECGGTGEVAVPEPVWPGEPHLADVGSAPCACALPDAVDAEELENHPG